MKIIHKVSLQGREGGEWRGIKNCLWRIIQRVSNDYALPSARLWIVSTRQEIRTDGETDGIAQLHFNRLRRRSTTSCRCPHRRFPRPRPRSRASGYPCKSTPLSSMLSSQYGGDLNRGSRKFKIQMRTYECIMHIPRKQCSGSVTFWYWSGSANPYHWITDQDPALLSVAFKMTKKYFV